MAGRWPALEFTRGIPAGAARLPWSVRRVLVLLVATLLGAASVAAAALGVRTFYRVVKYEYVSRGDWGVMVIPKRGRVDLLYFPRTSQDSGFLRIASSPHIIGGTDYARRVLGFGGGRTPSGGRFVSVPFWFIAVMFALPAVVMVRGEWRRRKVRPGLCPGCGYDVRATPERCPECGRVLAGK